VEKLRHGVYRARPGWALYTLNAEAVRRASEMVARGRATPSVEITPFVDGRAYELALIWANPGPPKRSQGRVPKRVGLLLQRLMDSAAEIAGNHPAWIESAIANVLRESLRGRRGFVFVTPMREHRSGGRSVLRVDG
jgi:hypothetical protein